MNELENASLKEAILAANILIIDDNPANVELLKEVLEEETYSNVKSVTDSREVSGLLAAERFDLLLLDINMPYLNGFDILEHWSEVSDGDPVPILVLTARNDHDTCIRALEMGATEFITKPFDQVELLNRINNLLTMRILHNMLSQQNETLELKVRERTRELYETRLEIINRLGLAAEFRDSETGFHIVRMSKYSASLAKAAGINENECELILQASPMHDLGKIGVPDKVLLKPAKLDAAEWKIMKTHPIIGASILSSHDSELMETARIIALTHHEKWDGTGYPYRLKGDDIPLIGRITAICDVFDALTSARPYKKAWSVEDSVAEIEQHAGTHFDPDLVQKFLDILPDILAIREQYPD